MLSLTAPCRENSKGIRIILWKKYQNLSCHKDMILLSPDHTDDRVWWVKRWHGGGVWDQNQPLFQIPSNNHEEHMTLESCEC